jgi:hypothetical protein
LLNNVDRQQQKSQTLWPLPVPFLPDEVRYCEEGMEIHVKTHYWWMAILAILAGVALYFALHLYAY